MTAKKPLVLLILDGWGYREDPRDNAIANANTPTWDRLWQQSPHTLVSGSGEDVGLPAGQMGNSEVGHMSLGAGRVIYQNISRIDKAISDGSFFDNPAYCKAIDNAKAAGKAVHIMGLLSAGGVHSHEKHILAMIEMAAQRGAEKIYLHAFLDGRDTPPRSASSSLQQASDLFDKLQLKSSGRGRIASICGRYYAMDRDQRWDRMQAAYDMLTTGKAEFTAASATAGLQDAYARDENDEFVKPTLIVGEGEQAVRIEDGDSVIFMNFRADRARQLSSLFTDSEFKGFTRERRPALAHFVMTTEYSADFALPCAFPPESLHNSLGEVLQQQSLSQLRIAETEKYAHVTFFFSGGREQTFTGEERILVSSPDVATYDLQPEMSAPEVTDKLVDAIENQRYDVIICNYANGDMVGHTGIFAAAVKAAEAIDESLRRVTEAVLKVDGECLITADHGNCEQMQDYDSQQAHTQHTTEHVPFIYVGNRNVTMNPQGGILADVAPTMLTLLGVEQPAEMTGHSLISLS